MIVLLDRLHRFQEYHPFFVTVYWWGASLSMFHVWFWWCCVAHADEEDSLETEVLEPSQHNTEIRALPVYSSFSIPNTFVLWILSFLRLWTTKMVLLIWQKKSQPIFRAKLMNQRLRGLVTNTNNFSHLLTLISFNQFWVNSIYNITL